MASVEQLTIQFSGKGAGKLTGQLNSLSKAMNRLAARQIEHTKELKKANKGLGLFGTKAKRNADGLNKLGLSFSTVRSKMLLFNFAMALGVRQLIDFTRQSAKVEAMERGFNTLTGATENSTKSLEKLKEATNGTMSEFDLFQQANNAMILGVSQSSDEMAEMFDIAQRLGSALGRDTKTSVESLITGIGRQSRMMLDNIGIITKVDKANEEYAKVLNKNVSQLTEAEKKQAFLNATMEAAREKVAMLGDEFITTQHQIDAFDAAMADLSTNVGKGLQGAFLPLMNAMTSLSKVMTPDRVQAYATVIGSVLVAAIAVYVSKLKQAVLWQTRLGWGALATAAGFLAGEILLMSGVFDDNAESLDLTAQKADALTKSLMKMSLAELIHQQQVLNAIVSDSFNPYENMLAQIEEYIRIVESGFSSFDDYTDKQTVLNELYKKTPEAQKAAIEANIAMTESMIAATGATPELIAILAMLEEQLLGMVTKEDALRKEVHENLISTTSEVAQFQIDTARAVADAKIEAVNRTEQTELNALKNTWLYQKMTDKQKAEAEKKITDKAKKERKKAKKEADKAMLKNFRVQQAMQIAQAVMNTSEAYTKVLGQTGILGIGLAPMVAAMGAIQIAMIAAQKPPKMQYGGLVGGRRHSAGGTMIEAEQGEFVMSRDATEAIGIENLNRLNTAGGGGGGSSIIINNPILGKDTIEDEIIPQIKEALRRGGDIGIG